MVVGSELTHQVIPMLEASFHRCPMKEVEEVMPLPPPAMFLKEDPEGVVEVPDLDFKAPVEPVQSVLNIQSGIEPRRYMEDEHIQINDLSGHLSSLLMCPEPNAFYGVFDGHGGSNAAAYMKMHAMRLFFEDSEFPRASEDDEIFSAYVETSIHKAFLDADLALADDSVGI